MTLRHQVREAARLELARRSLIHFVKRVSRAPGGYRPDWVHYRLCAALERFSEAVARKESPRLIISMPPRHGKTEIVSKCWPVWHMARYPQHEFVSASYGQELADDNSRIARVIARSDQAIEVFPALEDKGDKRKGDPLKVDKVNHWSVGTGSSYKAVGVGGPLTGRGAHVLAIDDPVKGRTEADSEATQKSTWSWYNSTAYTRLAPGGGVIVMATRWSDQDLIGKLIVAQEHDGDQWEIISLPAIAETDEIVDDRDMQAARLYERETGQRLPHDAQGRLCWRLEGKALHPMRFPLDRLERMQAAIRAQEGEREWAALYECRPVPAGGDRIKREWFRERYHCTPEEIAQQADEVWVTIDGAKKGHSKSDFHSLQAWAWNRSKSKRYVLDRVAGRMGYPEFERAADGMIAKWKHWLASKGGVLVEDTANGTTYLQVRGPTYLGVPLIAFSPTRDTPGQDKSKGARAVYLERAAEAGAIVLPAPEVAPWGEDLLTWWCAFPLGAHDDDVDSASQLNMRWTLQESGGGSALDAIAAELGW